MTAVFGNARVGTSGQDMDAQLTRHLQPASLRTAVFTDNQLAERWPP
ncbi:hypothetical protein [Mycolicibacterium sediminis]|nr:hypothetical protein [Mycolicibacterium sediminis]